MNYILKYNTITEYRIENKVLVRLCSPAEVASKSASNSSIDRLVGFRAPQIIARYRNRSSIVTECRNVDIQVELEISIEWQTPFLARNRALCLLCDLNGGLGATQIISGHCRYGSLLHGIFVYGFTGRSNIGIQVGLETSIERWQVVFATAVDRGLRDDLDGFKVPLVVRDCTSRCTAIDNLMLQSVSFLLRGKIVARFSGHRRRRKNCQDKDDQEFCCGRIHCALDTIGIAQRRWGLL